MSYRQFKSNGNGQGILPTGISPGGNNGEGISPSGISPGRNDGEGISSADILSVQREGDGQGISRAGMPAKSPMERVA